MSYSISVIIPTYNRISFLGFAIDSVLQQTYSDFELIIVDDGSTDCTQESIEKRYSNQLHYIFQKHQGVSIARNLGVSKSSKPWIAFLDSDDIWHPQKLEQQVEFLQNNTALNICQTDEIWIRKGKRVNPHQKHQKLEGDLYIPSLSLCMISPSSVLLKKSLFVTYGKFDPHLPACEDYDLWLRITSQERVGLVQKKLLTKTGGHLDQLSQQYFAMDRFRIYSLLKAFCTLPLTQLQKNETLKIIQKKMKILMDGKKKRGKEIKEIEKLVQETIKSKNFSFFQQVFQKTMLD